MLAPVFLLLLQVLSVPVVLATANGLIFSLSMIGMGKKRTTLIGSCMGVADVGAGFGLFYGLGKVIAFIYSSKLIVGNLARLNTYQCQRHVDDIMLGTCWPHMAPGSALTATGHLLKRHKETLSFGD